jgi:hypothetical protein
VNIDEYILPVDQILLEYMNDNRNTNKSFRQDVVRPSVDKIRSRQI